MPSRRGPPRLVAATLLGACLAALLGSPVAAAATDDCNALGLELFGHVDLIQVNDQGYWRASPESRHLTLQRTTGGAPDTHPGVRRGQQVCVGDELFTGPDVRAHVVSRWNDQLVFDPDTRGRLDAPSTFTQLTGSVLYYLGHPFRVLAGRTELVNEGTRFLVRQEAGNVYVAEGKVTVSEGQQEERLTRKEAAPLDLSGPLPEAARATLHDKTRRLSRILRPPRVAFGLDGTFGMIGLRGRPQTFAGPRLRLEIAPLRYLGLELTAAYHLGGALEEDDVPATHLMFSAGLGLRIAGLGVWGTFDGALVAADCGCSGKDKLALVSGFGGTLRYTFWLSKHVGLSVDGRVGWTEFVTGGVGAGLAWGW
jgi:hypothetical protein